MNSAPDAVYEQGWRDAIATAVQRVEAMPFSMLDKHDRLYAVEQVIDAIKEGQD